MLIDTHAHLNHERFFREVPEAVARAREAGVEVIVNVGFDLASSWLAAGLAEEHEGLYAVVGLHPHDAKDCTPALVAEVAEMTRLAKVVGVGEGGLDFHYDNSPRPQQKAVFAQFVELAGATGKPLIVHSREADQATLEILDAHLRPGQKVVLHCFGGNLNLARSCVERGFLLGIAGPVTYPNSAGLRQVVARMPLESLVLETDCPYLAPQARRGRRNEPAYVLFVAQQVAEARDISVEEVARVTTATAREFYGI